VSSVVIFIERFASDDFAVLLGLLAVAVGDGGASVAHSAGATGRFAAWCA
jgi:hypothetical protein